MSDAFFAVQQAVYSKLSGDSDVQALLGNPARIYDHVPPEAAFPYLVFGAVVARPFDDKDRTGFEQTITLDIWSRYRGGKEVKDIMQTIYSALHRTSLSVSGQVFISCEFASSDVTPESDGLTYRGEARFVVITQIS
jgi:hypothetical protein